MLAAKYGRHLPLTRQSATYAREVVEIDVSTLATATHVSSSGKLIVVGPFRRLGTVGRLGTERQKITSAAGALLLAGGIPSLADVAEFRLAGNALLDLEDEPVGGARRSRLAAPWPA